MQIIKKETYKILIKQKAVFIILILAAVCFLVSANSHTKGYIAPEHQKWYNDYMNNLKGRLTPEKEKFIQREEKRINKAIQRDEKAYKDFSEGRISQYEYTKITEQTAKAYDKQKAFSLIYDKYMFVKESPENRYFMDTRGWDALISHQNLNFYLFFTVLIVSALAFTHEYESGMSTFLITSRYGKRRLGIYKIILTLILTTALVLLFSLTEYLAILSKLPLVFGDYPLQSLDFFKTSSKNISILDCFLLITALKVAGFSAFAIFILFISILSKKYIPTLFTGFAAALIPLFLFPESDIKYRLPIFSGFMVGSGYFIGSSSGKSEEEYSFLFNEISLSELWQTLIFMLAICVILAVITVFIYQVKRFAPKAKKALLLALVLPVT